MVLSAFLMAVLVAMLAFSIDIGFIAVARTEAHRTSDAAALAAGWQMVDSMRNNASSDATEQQVKSCAQQFASCNVVCNHGPALSTSQANADVTLGYMSTLSSGTLNSDPQSPFRAVRVRVRKSQESNGQVPLFFARIFGLTGRDLTVESTAALAVNIRGFNAPAGESDGHDIMPFAIDQQTWDAMATGGGTDQFQWDAARQVVQAGKDGVREVNLYPQGTGSPGNRGTVDIGNSNNSTRDIARQIVSGISADDISALGKPLMLDSNGTMTLEGDTGISAGVKDELASIIGKTRIIPVFSRVDNNGNNAVYTIVRWEGVRILNVRLTGAMKQKQVIVQPTGVVARNVIPGDSSRVWSEGIYSPVVLVK